MLQTFYYCPGNVIIGNGEVKRSEKPESQMLIDYFILDKEKKTLKLYDDSIQDSFLDGFENIEKIQMEKNPDKEKQTRIITIQIKDSNLPIIIEIDKDNNIVGYNNQELKQIGDGFLYFNRELRELNLPRLTEVGNSFLYANEELRELNLPQLKRVGDSFLRDNKELKELNLPQLTEVGDKFLDSHPGKKELIANMHKKNEENKEIIHINPKEIAELDRNTELTTTEVNFGKEIIEKNISNKKYNIQK